MTSEHLARKAFRAISFDGRPQLPRGGYTQPCCGPAVGNNEERHETGVNADAARVRSLKIGPPADPFGGRQSVALIHVSALVRHRQALPPLRPAPLEHDATVFCGHSHAKTVGFLASTNVGLKCPLSLHACAASCYSKSFVTVEGNFNTSRQYRGCQRI